MKIQIRKTVEIQNIEQWFHVAPPEGGQKQWKVGRSALEMARFALSKEFPIIIDKLIKDCGLIESSFICEPEALTSFEKDMGKSGPRHHDLLMVGSDTIIGIEAKVSESFDKKVGDKRRNATDNMIQRLDSCLDYLYGKERRPQNAECLYYQLLSATIGSIIEANRQEKKNVISLFIVFEGNIDAENDYENHVKENDNAFRDFCNTFGLDDTGGKLPSIPGASDVNCWIKKSKLILAIILSKKHDNNRSFNAFLIRADSARFFFLATFYFVAKGLKKSQNFSIKVLQFGNNYFFLVGILAETGLIHHASIVLIG